jgi:lysophospholipase L1-like esterase
MERGRNLVRAIAAAAIAGCAGAASHALVDAASVQTPPSDDAGPSAPPRPAHDAAPPPDGPVPAADRAGADRDDPIADVALALDTAGTTGTPDAGAAAVRFIARVDRSDPAGPRFAWSGSTVLARFTGSSIGVRLRGPANYYDVRLDGALQPTLATSPSKEEYPLASNLAPGPHELSVYRRTEARQGNTTFLGLILAPGGALLPPPPPSGRRLEIVGDSTTCGYGDEGTSASCPFTPATENYDVAYGPVAARLVNAELITVAWSARGMYRNFAGDMKDTLPVLYGRTLADSTRDDWDHTAWVPDAVVINLGSNDFQQGDPGPAFVTTYTAFVQRLRQYYPKALIVCAVGPKLSGTQLAGARNDVMGLVAALNKTGDAQVVFVELPQAQPGDGFGCGGHASILTHKHMGEVLAALLKAKLGW